MKGKTILILGSGQIGEACAIRALKLKPKKIILHTLTREESKITADNVRQCFTGNNGPEIILSWGNALVTKELMHTSREELHDNDKYRQILLNYYYGFLSDNLIKQSSLYSIVKKWKPDYIFDGINTATVVGYQDDPYSLPRKVLKGKINSSQMTEHVLVSNIVPALIRFTQALKKCLIDFNVTCYVKISTTGLGGMGDNLMYTHGDINEPGMSSGILGKVAAAGVIHQLFWSLSHTPGINIKVIVPAALVGWQGVNYGKFRSHGKNIPLVDSLKTVVLKDGELFVPQICKHLKPVMEMPYVDSGENCAYSLGEMTAITSLGQMECVTREEVAQAAVELALGSTRHDLLTAMDMVALGPSHAAAIRREIILQQLSNLEKKYSTASIATNNLGPTVSKHLFELHALMECGNKSIQSCIEMDTKILAEKLEKYIFSHRELRSQILSLGLPILFNNNEALVGEYYYVPNQKDAVKISASNIDVWASSGWVDFRESQVKYWQNTLQAIQNDSEKCRCSNQMVLNRNWQKVSDGNIGELLGYAYSILGGERRTEF